MPRCDYAPRLVSQVIVSRILHFKRLVTKVQAQVETENVTSRTCRLAETFARRKKCARQKRYFTSSFASRRRRPTKSAQLRTWFSSIERKRAFRFLRHFSTSQAGSCRRSLLLIPSSRSNDDVPQFSASLDGDALGTGTCSF